VPARKTQNLAAIVGANISRRRRELGLTQAEMAEKLNMGGRFPEPH
jgi:DNA-binding XRE family transcriptional regulator